MDQKETELQDSEGIRRPSILMSPTLESENSRMSLRPSKSSFPPQNVDIDAALSKLPDRGEGGLESIRSPPLSSLRTSEAPRPIKSVGFADLGNMSTNPSRSATLPPKRKKGFLAIGDMIFLTSSDARRGSKEKSARFIVTGDGVAYNEVECVMKATFTERSERARYRQGLFRIEPARQYGFLTRLNQFTTNSGISRVFSQSQRLKASMKMQAEEEAEGNDDELEMSAGYLITYGERIQLRHMHSDSFLMLTNEVAREPGCLKIGLDKLGNEGSWCELQPGNKLRKEGELVQYSDQFRVSIVLDKSTYYVHMVPRTVFSSTRARELNGSNSATKWKAKKFIGRMELKQNPEFVSTGDSFRIALKQYQSYLTVMDIGVRRFVLIKEKIIEKKEDAKGDSLEQCKLGKAGVEEKPPETRTGLYLDPVKSSSNVWELEREDVFLGGISNSFESFKIKHIATGLYLSVESEKNLFRAVSDGSKVSTLFRLVPDVPQNPLRFNTLMKIQNVSTGLYITAEDLSSSSQKSQESTVLNVIGDKKNALKTTFYLEDEPELDSIHIHQIALIVQKISSFYKFLWFWGLLRVTSNEYIRDYNLARQTEQELEKETEIMRGIMSSLVSKVLRTDQPGFQQRQETVVKSKLLDLILELAKLVQEKTQFPKAFLRSQLHPRKGMVVEDAFGMFMARVRDWTSCPQIVAHRHLKPLASDIYKTLFRCIEGNGVCCQALLPYGSFLGNQLTCFKIEVGQLLHEAFKYSVNIFSMLPPEQFGDWVDHIKPVSSSNITEQAIVLKILASLCLNESSGVAKYQYLIRERLFQVPPTANLCAFRNYGGKQCLELIYRGMTQVEYDALKELLGDLLQDIEESGQHHYLLPIHSFSDKPELVRYFSTVLELLSNLCLSRNTESINLLTTELGASFSIIFECMRDKRIHPKLRTKLTQLCRVLYIDKDPCVPLADQNDCCF